MSTNTTITINSALHGDRIFRRIEIVPFRRKNGTNMSLAVWQGTCVMCGAPFEIKTPGSVERPGQSSAFLATNCSTHKLTSAEVTRLRCSKAADRPDIFAAIKAQKLA
jgi:hypothetical protein